MNENEKTADAASLLPPGEGQDEEIGRVEFANRERAVNFPHPHPHPLPQAGEGIDFLARTIWGEARGESVRGMEAVACVILNRAAISKRRRNYWWGNDVTSVCLKPFQFSCWNEGDPNREKLLAVTESDPQFAICLRIAKRALGGALPDITNGATHYHAKGCSPSWAREMQPCAEVGRHLFYREG